MRYHVWSLFGLIAIMAVCGVDTVNSATHPLSSIEGIPDAAWEKLAKKKIYFGHQSVGNNIMIGIEEIIKLNPAIKLNIVKLRPHDSISQPAFAHEEIGENDYPLTKTKALRDRLDGGLGEKLDIAFLKFCFWDIRSHTDVHEVFKDYKETVSSLHARYPHITFVHFTIPLMAYQTGIVIGAKRILHLPIEWDMDNIKRSELNDLILKEYVGKEPVFDIAAIESTLPDGSRAFFTTEGRNYSYLVQGYTKDGGHLNQEGRRRVAEQLLIMLAGLGEKLDR